jgi:hypothetical protein
MYLDAPEILFDRIPAGSITTGKVQVVAKVWGDHQGAQYLGHGRIFETAETFSQKIYSTVPVSGRKADSGTVYPNAHGLVGQGDLLPPWVNVTIFSETTYLKNKTNTGIYKSKIMAKGEILGGVAQLEVGGKHRAGDEGLDGVGIGGVDGAAAVVDVHDVAASQLLLRVGKVCRRTAALARHDDRHQHRCGCDHRDAALFVGLDKVEHLIFSAGILLRRGVLCLLVET